MYSPNKMQYSKMKILGVNFLGWIVMSGLMYCSSAEIAGITESDPFLGDIEGVIPRYQAHNPGESMSLMLSLSDPGDRLYNLPVDERGNFGIPSVPPGLYQLQITMVLAGDARTYEISDIQVRNEAVSYVLTTTLKNLFKFDGISTLWKRKQIKKFKVNLPCAIDIVTHPDDSVGGLSFVHSKGEVHPVDLDKNSDMTGFIPGFYFVTGSLGTFKKPVIAQYGIWITPDSTAIISLAYYQPTIIGERVAPPSPWEYRYKPQCTT